MITAWRRSGGKSVDVISMGRLSNGAWPGTFSSSR
jgi:hypothetical protein